MRVLKPLNALFSICLIILLFIIAGSGRFVFAASAELSGDLGKEALLAGVSESGLDSAGSDQTKIDVPFLGKIDVGDYSIPTLAVLLGLIDGFNPCAMWALVYLISLVASLNDKRRIWIIVGSFVLSSGILYFLFMSAWLNAFLVIGFFRPMTIVIGIVALYIGISGFVHLIRNKGVVACEVVGDRSKKMTMDRMKSIAISPLTLTTLISIVALAFIVNSIEFVCSCAIPAVFTHVLSISNLSRLEHYSYILLYDLFFMLDDLIIFGSAALAVNTAIANRYVVYCKVFGGLVMIGLGIVLLFMPDLLIMR